ncbi:unnamed protein product [Mycetohabitans rhizoxinica HKI 454]|uniref:Uncharacterized protein n=1 Tax=Mycetohabitans rhizoxinica (strain DSM 19002 / CIP 109453 / HKI 454) TaxID=882378 RepID=E5AR52_MYCRK|nr:hypothetical protein [Mycetohabitans rhizoxinica]CBW75084.1 unnamed protein product [Mycetohabitans rhizoxinica HKI 454]
MDSVESRACAGPWRIGRAEPFQTDLERALGGRLPTVAQHTGAVAAAVSVPVASQPTTRRPAAAHEQQEEH